MSRQFYFVGCVVRKYQNRPANRGDKVVLLGGLVAAVGLLFWGWRVF